MHTYLSTSAEGTDSAQEACPAAKSVAWRTSIIMGHALVEKASAASPTRSRLPLFMFWCTLGKKTNAAGRRRIRALGWQCVRGRREGGGVGRELVREGE